MDDITLGGTRKEVSDDVQLFNEDRIKIGLRLNETKCEVIARDHLQPTGSLEGFSVVSSENASHLGALLSPGDALDNALEVKCSDLRTAISRLKSIAAHYALILLRSSFSAPRLMHILRCAPCINHPLLLSHDSLLREGISVITISCLIDIHWLQASLSIRDGGLGIRRVSSLAFSAFFASAANTRDLQNRMLVASNIGVDTVIASAQDTWSSFNALTCPSETDARRQRSWDKLNVTRDVKAIWDGASSEMNKARL